MSELDWDPSKVVLVLNDTIRIEEFTEETLTEEQVEKGVFKCVSFELPTCDVYDNLKLYYGNLLALDIPREKAFPPCTAFTANPKIVMSFPKDFMEFIHNIVGAPYHGGTSN